MAVETKAAPAASDEKELLISGSEAVAEGSDPRRHRRGHGLPDPPVRHGHAGHRQEDRQRPARRRVHRGRGRAQPVRDRQARLHGGRARVLRLLGRGLGVRDGVPGGHPAAARCRWSASWATGRSTIPAPSAWSTTTRSSSATWAGCSAGSTPSQEAIDTTLIAYRVAEDRRVFLPLAISADGAFLTHSQAHHAGAAQGQGRPVPAALRPGRSAAAPRQPDHGGARRPTRTGSSRSGAQNDEAMKRATTVIEEAYADFRRVFGRGPGEPVVRGVHDRRRRDHPRRHGARSRCR